MQPGLTQYRTITEALEAAPADRVFVTKWRDEDDWEEVSFGEFRRRARVHAASLQNHGVGRGDRVVLIMPQSIAAMASFAGAMMIGAVPAFLAYPNFKIEPSKYRTGLAGVTANLAAKLVVIDGNFPEELLDHVAVGDTSTLIRLGGFPKEGKPTEIVADPDGEATAFIQHSAGTTGLQKGVALSHSAVLTQLRYLVDALQVDSEADRVYSWLPLYHDMGLIACFMLPMVCHLPVVMQSPLDWVMHPETMLRIITDHRCTLAWFPNFGFQFPARRFRPQRDRRYDLSSLRALINCSEPVRASSMQEFRQAFSRFGLRENAPQSSYAMAENVFAVTQSRMDGSPRCVWVEGGRFRKEGVIEIVAEDCPGAMPFVSSGKVLPNHRVRIVSNDTLDVAEGNVGEILIQSDCLFQGYYNRADLTTKAFTDGWYRTGDLGFLLDGELFVVGRKKDLLIIGGENLYPQDIEEVVAQHPDIHDGRVVALGIYNPELGTEEIAIVAEVEDAERLSDRERIEAEIRSVVVAALGLAARHIFLKRPKWIVKSTAGKPARSTTREKLLSEHPHLQYERQEA